LTYAIYLRRVLDLVNRSLNSRKPRGRGIASGSSSPGGSLTDYAWDFDGSKGYATDGGGSATISHTFSSPGTYTVDLRVKDSLGETATVSHTITVGAELGHYEQAVEETASVTHFWPMDESSGSSFADVIGGANAEALGGVTPGEPGGLVGDSSTAAAFDGSSGAARAEVDLSSTHQLTAHRAPGHHRRNHAQIGRTPAAGHQNRIRRRHQWP
jgi:PKD repeat protein